MIIIESWNLIFWRWLATVQYMIMWHFFTFMEAFTQVFFSFSQSHLKHDQLTKPLFTVQWFIWLKSSKLTLFHWLKSQFLLYIKENYQHCLHQHSCTSLQCWRLPNCRCWIITSFLNLECVENALHGHLN